MSRFSNVNGPHIAIYFLKLSYFIRVQHLVELKLSSHSISRCFRGKTIYCKFSKTQTVRKRIGDISDNPKSFRISDEIFLKAQEINCLLNISSVIVWDYYNFSQIYFSHDVFTSDSRNAPTFLQTSKCHICMYSNASDGYAPFLPKGVLSFFRRIGKQKTVRTVQ